ncbi:hypothetical protein CRUP_022048 [Coryphaenoides rupestris]|nr:hypothetical protein CRUP_022048 [Coryphaenoides rupestris]
MCSSRGLCRGGDRPPNGRSSRSRSSGSGSHYALCALGVGLIALGIVMIVWTVIPMDGEASGNNTSGNSSSPQPADDNNDGDEDAGSDPDNTKTSSVAFVLVGAGLVMLLLSICLGMRNKNRPPENGAQRVAGAAAGGVAYEVATESPEQQAAVAYDVPTYEEVVGSDTYPVSQSNLRQSIAHLPSYEDILAAVENEGAIADGNGATGNGATGNDATGEGSSPSGSAPHKENAAEGADASEPLAGAGATADPAAAAPNANPPARSSSRASRILRPLRVRRIKSDKLHLKDFRLHIRSPTHNPVTIEPITPPPQYDDKPPDIP